MLGYDEILTIYKYFSLHFTASQIALTLHIAPSPLYRMIITNIDIRKQIAFPHTYRYHECKCLPACRKTIERCPMECERFKKFLCDKLYRFPFICDFCESRSECRMERHFWNPVLVYQNRLERLKNTRSHLFLSKARIAAFDDWLSPFIRKKCSIEALRSQFPEAFPVSSATVRRWIDRGHMSIRRIDLVGPDIDPDLVFVVGAASDHVCEFDESIQFEHTDLSFDRLRDP